MGVRQGCPLSPLLFAIGTEGIFRLAAEKEVGYLIQQERWILNMFADDLTIYTARKRLGDLGKSNGKMERNHGLANVKHGDQIVEPADPIT